MRTSSIVLLGPSRRRRGSPLRPDNIWISFIHTRARAATSLDRSRDHRIVAANQCVRVRECTSQVAKGHVQEQEQSSVL